MNFSMLKMQQSEITRHKWRYLVIYELERLHQKRLAFVAPSSISNHITFLLEANQQGFADIGAKIFLIQLIVDDNLTSSHCPFASAAARLLQGRQKPFPHGFSSPSWIKASQFSSCQHMSTCVIINTTCVAALGKEVVGKFSLTKANIYLQLPTVYIH